MVIGGSFFGASSGTGRGVTTAPVPAPAALTAPAALNYYAAGANDGSMGLSVARRQQLLQGATPTTAAEQQWTTQVESGLRGYVQLLYSIAQQRAAAAQPTMQASEDHAYEQRVLELVNAERAAYGLRPLSYDARLDLASERHNLVMGATRTMAHSGIGDGDPGSRIRATGFNRSWGENVATGQLSPEQVVREWMASPGHRKNILDPEYRLLGVAYGHGSDGRTYWAQSFGA